MLERQKDRLHNILVTEGEKNLWWGSTGRALPQRQETWKASGNERILTAKELGLPEGGVVELVKIMGRNQERRLKSRNPRPYFVK